MRFYVYRHPIEDDEKVPTYYGEFKTYIEAEAAINTKFADEEYFYYEDFYIVEEDV